jgi:site-specific DNA-methyltransferase (adenine-specific)
MNTATQKIMFSSGTGVWSTPQDFFDKLNWRFGPFDLDPCASPYNTKCANFYTEIENGLSKDWGGHTVFVNPPYGRGIDKWIKKGYEESLKDKTKVVMLVPARTDTKYWHEYVMKAAEIHFIKGRLKFGDATNCAPFPSAVIVFDSKWRNVYKNLPTIYTMEKQ